MMASARPCRKCKKPTKAGTFCDVCWPAEEKKREAKTKRYDKKEGRLVCVDMTGDGESRVKTFQYCKKTVFVPSTGKKDS